MKNKFIAMLTITTMTLSLLVGCGQPATPNTNEDTSTEQNTEVDESGDDVVVEPTEEPIEEPTTEPEVEEPVVEPTEEPETPQYAYSHTWVFPDGLEGFTRKFLNEDYPEWSVNHTHYVAPNGNEMNFRWEGPAELGSNAGLGNNGKTLNLGNSSGEYALRAFTTGELSPEDYEETINYSKETIVSFASSDVAYIEDGYYVATIEDNYLSYIFAIKGIDNNENHQGYCHFFMDFENNACYQFTYLEDISIYDDERALSVVNSLEYWDYIPEE